MPLNPRPLVAAGPRSSPSAAIPLCPPLPPAAARPTIRRGPVPPSLRRLAPVRPNPRHLPPPAPGGGDGACTFAGAAVGVVTTWALGGAPALRALNVSAFGDEGAVAALGVALRLVRQSLKTLLLHDVLTPVPRLMAAAGGIPQLRILSQAGSKKSGT